MTDLRRKVFRKQSLPCAYERGFLFCTLKASLSKNIACHSLTGVCSSRWFQKYLHFSYYVCALPVTRPLWCVCWDRTTILVIWHRFGLGINFSVVSLTSGCVSIGTFLHPTWKKLKFLLSLVTHQWLFLWLSHGFCDKTPTSMFQSLFDLQKRCWPTMKTASNGESGRYKIVDKRLIQRIFGLPGANSNSTIYSLSVSIQCSPALPVSLVD